MKLTVTKPESHIFQKVLGKVMVDFIYSFCATKISRISCCDCLPLQGGNKPHEDINKYRVMYTT